MRDKGIESAVSLTRYLMLPSVRWQFLFLLMMSIMYVVSLSYIFKDYEKGVWLSLATLLFPFIISFLLARVILRIPFRRIMPYAALMYILFLLSNLAYFITSEPNVLILLYSGITILSYLLMYFVYMKRFRGLIISFLQLLLFSYSMYMVEAVVSPQVLIPKVVVALTVLAITIYLIIMAVNAPLKKMFDVSATRALSAFLSQWIYESRELDEDFESVGVRVRTWVDILRLRAGDSEATLVVPHVHFGPFGNLGGSNFPALLGERLDGDVCVFHGAATHDYNPVREDEIQSILKAVETSKGHLRPVKGSFKVYKKGASTLYKIVLDGDAMFIYTRAPHTTEDMDNSLGRLLREIGNKKYRNTYIIDAHNYETGDITQFMAGLPEGEEYVDLAYEAIKDRDTMNPVRYAFTHIKPDLEGLGGNGIFMNVFSFGRRKVALITFDSNSVSPRVYTSLGEALRAKGYVPIVTTTDTHYVNKIRGVLNPLNDDRVVPLVVENLPTDLKPLRYWGTSKYINIKVFGPRQALKLIGVVSTMAAMLKYIIPLLLLFGAFLTLWALSNL